MLIKPDMMWAKVYFGSLWKPLGEVKISQSKAICPKFPSIQASGQLVITSFNNNFQKCVLVYLVWRPRLPESRDSPILSSFLNFKLFCDDDGGGGAGRANLKAGLHLSRWRGGGARPAGPWRGAGPPCARPSCAAPTSAASRPPPSCPAFSLSLMLTSRVDFCHLGLSQIQRRPREEIHLYCRG